MKIVTWGEIANMVFLYIYLNKSRNAMEDQLKMERELFFWVHM